MPIYLARSPPTSNGFCNRCLVRSAELRLSGNGLRKVGLFHLDHEVPDVIPLRRGGLNGETSYWAADYHRLAQGKLLTSREMMAEVKGPRDAIDADCLASIQRRLAKMGVMSGFTDATAFCRLDCLSLPPMVLLSQACLCGSSPSHDPLFCSVPTAHISVSLPVCISL
ncbi:unnamed protein product [Protopolystoma xenopodis]|uniref:Uncharacterized protein n=1 Tax=Protopolystoma xenopodis TaxID=117903 RepID=A0A3S5A2D7_9PLAT|nr:unnamed protein product [Protopolystoma xenopodis]